MPITHPEYNVDFTLVFANKSFQISKCLFGLYSSTFCESFSKYEKYLDLTDEEININSFKQFVKACQSRYYNITIVNCFDLLNLCTKWNVKAVKDEIESFLSNFSDTSIIISKLQVICQNANHHNNINQLKIVDDIENLISKKINFYLNDQSFYKLPPRILSNIISKSISFNKTQTKSSIEIDHHLFFNFFFSALTYHQENSLILIDLIEDYGKFTPEEMKSLVNCSVFCQKSHLKDNFKSFMKTTKNQMNQLKEMKQKLLSVQEEKDNLLKKLKQRVDLLNRKIPPHCRLIGITFSVPSCFSDLILDFETRKVTITDINLSTSNLNMSKKANNSIYSSGYFNESKFIKKNDVCNTNLTKKDDENDDIMVKLENKNALTVLTPFKDKIFKYQTKFNKSMELMKRIEKKIEQIISLNDALNLVFDSSFNQSNKNKSKESRSTYHKSKISKKKMKDEPHSIIEKASENQKQPILRTQGKTEKNKVNKDKSKKKSKMIDTNISDGCNESQEINSPKLKHKRTSLLSLKKPAKTSPSLLMNNLFSDEQTSDSISDSFDNNSSSDQKYIVSIPYIANTDPFNGIINFIMTNMLFGFGDSNKIDVQASSSLIKSKPDIICNYNNSIKWISQNLPYQWVRFDFMKLKVKLSHYSIQTIPNKPFSSHLKNWNIEGTNADGFSFADVKRNNKNIHWEIIDSKENDFQLNNLSQMVTFNANSNKFFRYIRLRTTGPNHEGTNYLAIRKIEFFGELNLSKL